MFDYSATPFWKENGANMSWDSIWKKFSMNGGLFADFVALAILYENETFKLDYLNDSLRDAAELFAKLNPDVNVVFNDEILRKNVIIC